MEREADRFAAELLVPQDAIRNEIETPVTLTGLLELKGRWGVSIQSLIVRARDLRLIGDRQYRYLFEQIGHRGWRVKEPAIVPMEKPRALRKMAELVYGLPMDYRKLAADLSYPPPLVRAMIEAHAGTDELPKKSRPDNVVHLHVRRGRQQ
jgi:Zn-dependent peptidase ImmA (M78 family)